MIVQVYGDGYWSQLEIIVRDGEIVVMRSVGMDGDPDKDTAQILLNYRDGAAPGDLQGLVDVCNHMTSRVHWLPVPEGVSWEASLLALQIRYENLEHK